VPLRYLPSGRVYSHDPHEAIGGVLKAFHNRWLIAQAYQRHLLQLGFTDRLLGGVLGRLREKGMYDRSLIVVTADNGESFGQVGNRHEISRRNAADIALTPLFVKLPHQRHGRVVSRHVRTVDVLPTIAHVTGVRVPRGTQGISALGPLARRIPASTTLIQRSGHHLRLSLRALQREGRKAVRRKLRRFGSGPLFPGLYRIGPHPSLLLRPVAQLPVSPARRLRAVVNPRSAAGPVRLRPRFAPSYLTGRLVGATGRRRVDLAVALNGLVVATVPSFRLSRKGPELFSAIIPEEAFHDGSNEVSLFRVDRRGDGVHLRALKLRP
jgi:hypothetical protein